MLASMIPSLQAQEGFLDLAFQYMYHHIAINLAQRKYLRFRVGPNH